MRPTSKKTDSILQHFRSDEGGRFASVPPALLGSCSYRVLEKRMVFDGAAAATVADAASSQEPLPAAHDGAGAGGPDAPAEPSAADVAAALAGQGGAAGPSDTEPSGAGVQIVFIDSRVTDPGVLATAAPEGTEIVMLDRNTDGLEQIAAYLDGRSDVEAIHVVSHGEPGELTLGASAVDLASLAGEHADELAVIRSALSAEADILLYGCNVADGEVGQAFVQALSEATGADVAASSDDTGSATRGGDWDLEIRTGLIEAGLIDAPEWNGLLAPLNIEVSGDPILSGPGGGAYDPFNAVGGSALWTNAGTVGETSIDIRATVVSTTTLNAGVNPTPYVGFITSNFEDMQVIVWNGSATIQWEIFASGTNQTVYAVGSPNFSIRDLDGLNSQNLALPNVELEAVVPSLNGLTSYSVENNPASPSTLAIGVVGSDLYVAGTINHNAEPASMVSFGWTEVSSWTVRYVANTSFVNPDNSISARFYYHDGDGDFTFVAPNTTFMLGIDLDANNSTAPTTSYQTTFTENGSPVPVVDTDVTISQHAALGSQVHQGTVRLTNAQAGDLLLVNGSSAASGSFSVAGATFNYTVTTAAGQSEVVLTGTATLAQYQAALSAITFSNTSEAPSTVDRQIEVFVSNTTFGTSSNQAVSTIHVVAVNDPPAGINDTIPVTEDTPATQNVLGNDTDADGDPLTISSAQIDWNGDGTPDPLVLGAPTAMVTPTGAAIGVITVAANGDVTFAPAQNYTGPVPNLTYTPNDGTVDGTPATVTFGPIVPVDDLVTASTPPDQTTPEDTPLVFSAANGNAITLVDPDGVSGGAVIVQIEVPASTGTLTLGGTGGLLSVSGNGTNQVIVTGSVADVNAALNGLTFTPAADWNGVVPSDLAITMTRPADLGFVNAGFELPAFTGAPGANFVLESAVPGWETSATDNNLEIWESGFLGVPAFEGNQFVELNAFQVSTLSQTFTPTNTGGDLTLTFAHRGRQGADTMNVTAIDLGANGVVGGGDDTVLFSGNYTTGNADWQQYQADLGTASGNPILLQFNSVSAAGGNNSVGNFLDAISIYDSSLSTTATVGITVTPVGDTVDDTVTTNEDTAITFNVLAGTNGAEADNFENLTRAVTAVTQGAHGSVSFAADGTVTYTSDSNFYGTDTFTYTVTSPAGITETATVTVTVDPVNDPPVATDDTLTVSENGPAAMGDVTPGTPGQDGDLDGDALTVTQVNSAAYTPGAAITLPSGALLTMNTDGTYSYDPNGAFESLPVGATATDSFTYQVSDGNGGFDTATVTLTVNGANDAPVAVADTNAGTESQALSGNLIAGTITAGTGAGGPDTDVDGGALTVTGLSAGTVGAPIALTYGTLTIQPDGSYTFVPNATANTLDQGQVVTEQITYTVSDGNGGTAQATLTLTITGENDAPINAFAIPASNAVDGGSVSIPTLAAFSDPDGEALTFSLAPGAPAWLSIDPFTGIITGTPPADASISGVASNGVYTFAVIATDPGGAFTSANATLTVSNLPPVAVDDAASVGEDGPALTGNVITDPLTGDADTPPDSDPLTVTGAEQNGTAITIGQPFTVAGGGTLTLNFDGSYTFDPGTAYNGLDDGETEVEVITYTVSDGNGGTDSALLVITVQGANDAPVVIDPLNPGTPENPIPATDPLNIIPDVTTSDGAALTPIPVGTYVVDPDGEPLTFTVDPATPPWIAIDPVTGTITGTPPSDASQNSNTGNPGEYLITITATDPDGALVTTTVTLTIVNLDPVAVDDAASVGEDGPAVTGNVITDPLTGDADTAPDSDPLTVTGAEQNGNAITIGQPFTVAGGGVLTLNPDGSYTFDPGTAYNGLDDGETEVETISYTVSDGNGGTDSALLVITVQGANDAPVIVDPNVAQPDPENPVAADPATVIPVQQVDDGADFSAAPLIDVSAYALDPDGDPLTFTTSIPLPAGLTLNADGTVTGIVGNSASQGGDNPQNNPGVYTITVDVSDGTTTSQVTLVIDVSNPPPVAENDRASTRENVPVSIRPLVNDRDPDGDALTVVSARAPHGTVVIKPNGTLVYTPRPGFAGTDVIRYTVSDGEGGFAIATVSVKVDPAVIPTETGPGHPDLPGPPAISPSLVVGGAVLNSANGADISQGAPSVLGNSTLHVAGQSLGEGAVISALGQFQPLNGMPSMASVLSLSGLPPLGEGQGIVSTEAERLGEVWSAMAGGNPWTNRGTGSGDLEGLTGFSLKYGAPEGLAGLGEKEPIAIESLVRKRVLMLNVQSLGDIDGQEITGFRYLLRSGEPLPDWLDDVADGYLAGEPPADLEEIEITVEAVLEDGSVIAKDVRINTVTGEISSIAPERRADVVPLFTRQLGLKPQLSGEEIEALGRALAR